MHRRDSGFSDLTLISPLFCSSAPASSLHLWTPKSRHSWGSNLPVHLAAIVARLNPAIPPEAPDCSHLQFYPTPHLSATCLQAASSKLLQRWASCQALAVPSCQLQPTGSAFFFFGPLHKGAVFIRGQPQQGKDRIVVSALRHKRTLQL